MATASAADGRFSRSTPALVGVVRLADLLPLLVGESGGVHLEIVGEAAPSVGVMDQSKPPQLWGRCRGCWGLSILSSLSIISVLSERAQERRRERRRQRRVCFLDCVWVACLLGLYVLSCLPRGATVPFELHKRSKRCCRLVSYLARECQRGDSQPTAAAEQTARLKAGGSNSFVYTTYLYAYANIREMV